MEPPKEAVEEAVEESVPQIVNGSIQEIAKDALTETATALPADAAANVVPFRAPGASLTPVENSAFDELARQLSARLDTENGNEAEPPAKPSSIRWPHRLLSRRPNGWRRPSHRRVAKRRATRRCSISCRSAS